VRPYRLMSLLAVTLAVMLHSAGARAATFTTLHSFVSLDDGSPNGALLPVAGRLFGTTGGSIYSIDPATGEYTLHYGFAGPDAPNDGREVNGGLVLLDGLIYGTSLSGGLNGLGTIFSFDPRTGIERVVYNFGPNKAPHGPTAGLTEVNGVLLGTTAGGGTAQRGTVFRFDPKTAALSVLHSFLAGQGDGAYPGAPVLAVGSMLYGTTENGGPADTGTVWAIDMATGAERILHFFGAPRFSGNPRTGVVHHAGKLYGTTRGGPGDCQKLRCGRLYQVDVATGAEVDLHLFDTRLVGNEPTGELVLAHGVLHGSTSDGVISPRNDGSVYAFDLESGTGGILHRFAGPDGSGAGTLTLWQGRLYGTKFEGGENRIGGTVFVMDR